MIQGTEELAARGLHLLIDGLAVEPLDTARVWRFLVDCPEEIGMTIISGPDLYVTSSAWCAIVVIAESHISVHVNGPEVHVDIFSCKPFETETAAKLAKARLGLEPMRVAVIERGWSVSG